MDSAEGSNSISLALPGEKAAKVGERKVAKVGERKVAEVVDWQERAWRSKIVRDCRLQKNMWTGKRVWLESMTSVFPFSYEAGRSAHPMNEESDNSITDVHGGREPRLPVKALEFFVLIPSHPKR